MIQLGDFEMPTSFYTYLWFCIAKKFFIYGCEDILHCRKVFYFPARGHFALRNSLAHMETNCNAKKLFIYDHRETLKSQKVR